MEKLYRAYCLFLPILINRLNFPEWNFVMLELLENEWRDSFKFFTIFRTFRLENAEKGVISSAGKSAENAWRGCKAWLMKWLITVRISLKWTHQSRLKTLSLKSSFHVHLSIYPSPVISHHYTFLSKSPSDIFRLCRRSNYIIKWYSKD